MVPTNKKILLGVTGSIAVYKSVELARRLVEEGASVHVIMTDASRHFVAPLTFEVVSREKVSSDLYADPLSHITLTADADLMVVAPATANAIGKFAHGIADDLLSTCMLSFKGTVIIAPAMNWRMYENPVVQNNLRSLASHGVIQVGPDKGSLACGDDAVGRMSDIQEIVEALKSALTRKDLLGRRILVTAGPTREYLDPVRFLSNRSSGKMGFAVARAALRRGAKVTVVKGPTELKPPPQAEVISVETALEMREAVLRNLECDALIMTAAVADFAPAVKREKKIEKSDVLSLDLMKNPDILSEVGRRNKRPLLVGFSAEAGPDLERARRKRAEKGVDLMVFNDISSPGAGFDTDTNEITIIEKDGTTAFPLMPKDEVAGKILDRVAHLLLDFS